VLNTNVTLLDLVELDSEMSEDRAGVHALVDPQERHSYTRQIVRCQRPEASVCVSIFGTNSRMKNKRPEARDRKDALGQDVLAERDDNVGLRRFDEGLALPGGRRRNFDDRC
jgi:hypothetical protein